MTLNIEKKSLSAEKSIQLRKEAAFREIFLKKSIQILEIGSPVHPVIKFLLNQLMFAGPNRASLNDSCKNMIRRMEIPSKN
jgi:hypothetical protein